MMRFAVITAALAVAMTVGAVLAWRDVTSEARAKVALSSFANKILKPEYATAPQSVRCRRETDLLGFRAAFHCDMPTACGPNVQRVVHSSLIGGRFLPGERLSYQFLRVCKEMLQSEIADRDEKLIDQGG